METLKLIMYNNIYIMTCMGILLLTFNPNIEHQLKCIYKQTIKPDYLMIIQIGNYMDITYLKETYDFIHVKQESEVPFHRFYQALCYNVDYYFFMDIMILPQKSCFEYYIQHCETLNSIIGNVGIISNNNKNIENKTSYYRNKNMKVDYLTEFVCIKQEHLKNIFLFNKKECHMNRHHEFMYLCYINKIKNIDSRIIMQTEYSYCRINNSNLIISMIKENHYRNFIHLQKETKTIDEVTQLIDEYFINEYDFKFIDNII